MTNSLTVITNDISTPEKLAALRINKDVPHFRAIARTERCTMLADLIMQAYILKHQTPELGNMSTGQVVELDAAALDGFIMEDIHISDYTFAEIGEAFRMGLVGKFGEYFGLNSLTFFGFLQGYLKTDKKLRAIKIVQQYNKKKKQEEYDKKQRELARMKGWGVKVKTVTWDEMVNIAKNKEI